METKSFFTISLCPDEVTLLLDAILDRVDTISHRLFDIRELEQKLSDRSRALSALGERLTQAEYSEPDEADQAEEELLGSFGSVVVETRDPAADLGHLTSVPLTLHSSSPLGGEDVSALAPAASLADPLPSVSGEASDCVGGSCSVLDRSDKTDRTDDSVPVPVEVGETFPLDESFYRSYGVRVKTHIPWKSVLTPERYVQILIDLALGKATRSTSAQHGNIYSSQCGAIEEFSKVLKKSPELEGSLRSDFLELQLMRAGAKEAAGPKAAVGDLPPAPAAKPEPKSEAKSLEMALFESKKDLRKFLSGSDSHIGNWSEALIDKWLAKCPEKCPEEVEIGPWAWGDKSVAEVVKMIRKCSPTSELASKYSELVAYVRHLERAKGEAVLEEYLLDLCVVWGMRSGVPA